MHDWRGELAAARSDSVLPDLQAVGCGVLLLLLVISLCMIRMVRHINIIDELKKSD